MTDSLVFDDLLLLARDDLLAVLQQVPHDDAVAALWGAAPSLRGQILRKLPTRHGRPLDQAIAAVEHLPFQKVWNAQQLVLSAMRRLSRNGQIAFDIPEDMVA